MAKKPISQSDTRWVKKEGKRGYVEQISTGKRVTGKVKLSADTTKGKAGEIQRYKAGVGKKASPLATGAGTTGGKPKAPPAGSSSTSRSNPARPPAAPPAKKTAAKKAAAVRKAQNAGVKDGTVRSGAKGRGVRKYDSKTGRWERVTGATGATTTSSQSQKKYGPNVPVSARPSASGTPSNYTGFSVNKPGGGSPPKGKTGQVFVGGRWVAANSSAAKTQGPKKGDKKTTMSGVAVWDGSKWVKAK